MKILKESEYKKELRQLFLLLSNAKRDSDYKNPYCDYAASRRQLASFKFAKRLNAVEDLRYFLSKEGDCTEHPLLFGGIFFGIFTDETHEYVFEQLKNMRNNQGRNLTNKASQLVDGWTYEYILMKTFGLKKSGTDSNFLLKIIKNKKSNKSSAHDADLFLGRHKVEVMSDSGGWILEKNSLDFRLDKWDELLSEESYVFAPLGNNGRYFLYHTHDLNESLSKEYNTKVFGGGVRGTRTYGWDKLSHHDINYNQILNHFNYIQYGKSSN